MSRSRLHVALAILAFLLCTAPAGSAEADITGVSVVDFGLYDSARFGRVEASATSTGDIRVDDADSIRLLEKTDRIPAEIGRKFGIRYVLRGDPAGARVAHTVKVLSPGLARPQPPGPQVGYLRQPPATPRSATSNQEQWQAFAAIDSTTYNGFVFEHDWELVPGTWTIQICYGDRVLAQQRFSVYGTPKSRAPADLPPELKKVVDYLQSPDCSNRMRAVHMVKVLGKEAAPALPYLIRNLEAYSLDHQMPFDCGCAKETPSALAAIGADAVGPLLETPTAGRWNVREGVLKSLRLIGKPALEPLLAAAAGGKNLDSRVVAIAALGQFKERSVATSVSELVVNGYFPEVRVTALETLEKVGDPVAVPSIIYALHSDKVPELRAKAAEVLGSFDDARAVEALTEVVLDAGRDSFIRETALKSLVQRLDPAQLLRLLPNITSPPTSLAKSDVFSAVASRDDDELADFLAGGLADPDSAVRNIVMESLLKNKNSGHILKSALTSSDSGIKSSAALELGRRNDPAADPLLLDFIAGADPATRVEAAVILAKRKDARAYETLLQLAGLQSSDPAATDRTVKALRALGEVDDAKALSVLKETLKAQNSYLLEAALEAMGQIRTTESAAFLVQYLANCRDQRLDYSFKARESLIKIGTPALDPLLETMATADLTTFNRLNNGLPLIAKGIGPRCIPRLAKAAREGTLPVKRACLAALSIFPDPGAAQALVEAFGDRQLRHDAHRGLCDVGKAAVPKLLPLLNHGDSEVRFAALVTLGHLGEVRALRPLIKALKDPKRKMSAIGALGGIKAPRAARRLIELLKDPNPVARDQAVTALGSVGDTAAVVPLLVLLQSEAVDRNGRIGIVRSLGKLGDRKSSPYIVPFLKAENGQDRIVAAEALMDLGAPDSADYLVEALNDTESIVRDYAYGGLKKMTKMDCGIYPDAWQIWLERNKIPEPPPARREQHGFWDRLVVFAKSLLQQIVVWWEDLVDGYFA